MNNVSGVKDHTQCDPRFLNHNVAIALMSDKKTLVGPPAISEIGAKDGDKQVHWMTFTTEEDHQNVHSASLNSNLALLTWERVTNPKCQPLPMGCLGTFSGTVFQFINSDGDLVGSPVTREDVTVAGDIATIGEKVCWPYVDRPWDVSKTLDEVESYTVTAISIACASNSDKNSGVSKDNSTISIPSPVSGISNGNNTHINHKKHKHSRRTGPK